jgi:hypothetical protein
MPPLKGTFMEVITAVADGKGFQKTKPKLMANESTMPTPKPQTLKKGD